MLAGSVPSKTTFCTGSEIHHERWSTTICASPSSDCSSSRNRPPAVHHSRPLAPCSSGSTVRPVRSVESIRLSVNVMSALTPVTGCCVPALSAAWIPLASVVGRGTGPAPVAATAIAAQAAAVAERAEDRDQKSSGGGGAQIPHPS